MASPGLIILTVLGYLGLLFAIAAFADRRAALGRSVINNPYVYTLSLTVYATAWTFYGSVGRAATTGIDFLAVYIGPTLMAILWWLVLRKIIRISKQHRLTSIADFISARYGNSQLLAALVTLMAMAAVTPYIALQLKAITVSFEVLAAYPTLAVWPVQPEPPPVLADTAFYAALILAVFTILFGARQLDAAERHEGMVAAVACEGLFKLAAFVAVGLFVVYGLFGGLGDLFTQARTELPALPPLAYGDAAGGYFLWIMMIVVSLLAILLLPRQFQVAVVENVDEGHVRKAMWLFPLYMLLITVFTLPIAYAGLLLIGDGERHGDVFVLLLPLLAERPGLALLVFLGGLSAATAMVIVETVALATMASNNLIVPLLMRWRRLRLAERESLTGLLLTIRRLTIFAGILAGYAYFRGAGHGLPLVELGLIAFAGVAQFGPAVIGGIFWKGGNRIGAIAGMSVGFLAWLYTLVLPLYTRAGWFPERLLEAGPLAQGWLRPEALFGLEGLDPVAHGAFWALLLNLGAYVVLSLSSRQTLAEQLQASAFVDVFHGERGDQPAWRARGQAADLQALLARTLGQQRATAALAAFAERPERRRQHAGELDVELVRYVETLLVGAVGAANARALVGAVVQEEPLRDGLTGLPNRTLLLSELTTALQRKGTRSGAGFALLVLNLDRFRLITNSLGYQAGEQVLVEVARRLQRKQQDGELLARLAGDQFGVLLPQTTDPQQVCEQARRYQNALLRPIVSGGAEVFLSACVGAALSPHYDNHEDLLRDAETALQRAKALGAGRCEVFETGMHQRAVQRLQLEGDLRRALERQEFELHYQPIVCLADGRLAGFEALLRWRKPDGSLIPPDDFIPLTEETDMILPIGEWALNAASSQLAEWLRRYPGRPLQISVNLSPRQLLEHNLLGKVRTALRASHLPAGRLKLEITESAVMQSAETSTAVLNELRAMQVPLSLDDFGTGYSSLSYLRRLPVNTLKIDQSFIRDMETDAKQAGIVESTIMLAHRLGLDVIAEGVESASQAARLQALGVEYGQGYHFGAPMPAAAAEQLLQKNA